MSLKVKNNLSVISLINNKLSAIPKGNAEKILRDLVMIYAQENKDTAICATMKTLAYCCGKLEDMGAREGYSVVRFLLEQYTDLTNVTPEQLAETPYMDEPKVVRVADELCKFKKHVKDHSPSNDDMDPFTELTCDTSLVRGPS